MDQLPVYLRSLDEYFKSITTALVNIDEPLYREMSARVEGLKKSLSRKVTGSKTEAALEEVFLNIDKSRALVAAHEDILLRINQPKIIAQVALMTTPTKIDLLEKLASSMSEIAAGVAEQLRESYHKVCQSMETQDIDVVRALATKYEMPDMLLARMHADADLVAGRALINSHTTVALDRLSTGDDAIVTAFPMNHNDAASATDLVFDIRPLLDARFIVEHGLDKVTPDMGINQQAIDATRTIMAGVSDEAPFMDWSDEDVRVEKAISGAVSGLIMRRNFSPLTLDALMTLDADNSREKRQQQNQYRGIQRSQMDAGVHILDTVKLDNLYDMWRYKEVKNVFMSYSRSKSKSYAIGQTIKSRQYGANDTPMAMIYERELAVKHFE